MEPKGPTLPKTNIIPENGWLEEEFPFGMAYFQVLCWIYGGYAFRFGDWTSLADHLRI